MKKEDLEAIKRRCGKATPGPWKWEERQFKNRMIAPCPPWIKPHHPEPYVLFIPDRAVFAEDMEFIAHARSDIPALVAHVEKLREIIDEMRIYYTSPPHVQRVIREAMGEE